MLGLIFLKEPALEMGEIGKKNTLRIKQSKVDCAKSVMTSQMKLLVLEAE